MFWLRNKKSNFVLRTLLTSPVVMHMVSWDSSFHIDEDTDQLSPNVKAYHDITPYVSRKISLHF